MRTLLKEPLFHFLVLGAALFLLDRWMSDGGASQEDRQIVVSAGRIEQFARIFQKTWQRPPSAEELQGVIDEFVLEEAYYRQAVAMGIDRDDTAIRRRLRQKLEFLTEAPFDQAAATDDDLAAYLAEHSDKFRQSPTYTFRQVYFNPETHADKSQEWFDDQRERLIAGERVGDSHLIPGAYRQADRREVDSALGTGFSGELDQLETNSWHGPVRSGLGLHLIRLDERVPGRLPDLAEIRPQVEREWAHERRQENRRTMNETLLDNYDIVVQWPEKAAETEKD